MPYAVELSLLIALASLTTLLFLTLLLYPFFRHLAFKHNLIYSYYKRIYRVALDEDFYLINAFKNKTADEETFHIDHILIGNKFIYCIRDRYYDGAIRAKEKDQSWVFYSKKDKKGKIIPNPLRMNALRVDRMSLMTNLDKKLFISVVLVNDDCLISPYEVTYPNNFVVSLKNFPSFIRQKESLPIEPMDPRALDVAAKDIAQLNQNGKKED